MSFEYRKCKKFVRTCEIFEIEISGMKALEGMSLRGHCFTLDIPSEIAKLASF